MWKNENEKISYTPYDFRIFSLFPHHLLISPVIFSQKSVPPHSNKFYGHYISGREKTMELEKFGKTLSY